MFRREPVWKVSMNLKLGPGVRCTLDEEQGILRVVLKEAIEKEGLDKDQWPQEVVVYAVKVSCELDCSQGIIHSRLSSTL